MSYYGVPVPDPVFVDEVKRFQTLYPRKPTIEIAEHFRMDTPTGIKVIQGILAEPDMRRYRRGVESVGPLKGRGYARRAVG